MDNRLFSPASQRNKKYIGDVLSRIILRKGSILEIGSGSGEHGIAFQKRFPEIIWQLSDLNLEHRKSISSWIQYEKLNLKMPQPLVINIEEIPWVIPSDLLLSLQGIICINVIHVSSWGCTKSLFEGSGKILKYGQFLMLYGPFKIGKKYTSESNYLFDKKLRLKNRSWGLRDLEEVNKEGTNYGFKLDEVIAMPANNLSVIYRKVS